MSMDRPVLAKMLCTVLVFTIVVLCFAGCSKGKEPGQTETTKKTSQVGSYQESPMLTSLVNSKQLPSLKDRLPEKPKVTTLGSKDAKYGGELRLAFTGSSCAEYSWMNSARFLNQEGMGTTNELPYANVAESYTVNDDATVYTFKLRKGLKWSDGEPVTTEDVRFWWEDVENNKNITPTVDAMWTSNGKPMELKIIDEYTFSCTFEDPYVLFPWQLSLRWRGNSMFLLPSHYLKEFHIDYAEPKAYKEKLQKAGYSEQDWGKYFIAEGWGPNGPNEFTTAKPGCPVITPFVIVDHPSPTVWIAERNPYYFEVDEQGRQLPYIDKIRLEQVSDSSMLPMKAMAGEVDYLREAMSTLDIPILKENEEKGGYRVLPLAQHSSIYFNLNYGYDADKGWMELVNNRKFRQALNYAINRNEILSNLYLDQGKVSYHFPGEYNVDKANALLDEIGMNKRDSEGFRTRPDGSKFQIDFEYAKLGTEFSEFVEIIRQNWADIGIRVLPKEIDRSLWSQKRNSNEIQTIMIWCDIPVMEGNPVMWDWSIPIRSSAKYLQYFQTSGQSGDVPESDLLEIFQKTFKMKQSKSLAEMNATWSEIKQLLFDTVIWFVPVEDIVAPVVYSNRLENVTEEGYMIESNINLLYAYIK